MMAVQAVNRSPGLALLTTFEVTGFTLAVESVFQIKPFRLGLEQMTGFAFFHRLALLPAIAPALIVMVTGNARNALQLMELMAEGYRRLLRGLKKAVLNYADAGRLENRVRKGDAYCQATDPKQNYNPKPPLQE
jgi:hypothetical protein